MAEAAEKKTQRRKTHDAYLPESGLSPWWKVDGFVVPTVCQPTRSWEAAQVYAKRDSEGKVDSKGTLFSVEWDEAILGS